MANQKPENGDKRDCSKAEVDAKFREALARIQTAKMIVLGIPSDVGAGFRRGANLGPQAMRTRLLEEVDDRWFRLAKLLRKHGPTTHELLAHKDDLKKQLDQLAGAGALIDQLEKKRDTMLAQVTTAARQLSRKRRDAAATLADSIGKELAGLGMGRARVIVDVSPVPAPQAGELPPVDGARLTQSGIDRVEFLIAPNKGEDPRPLRKIASGGELSRALLALKRVLADQGPAGLYVFDEVDAGVSGAIAEVIGRAIADVARHRQVLCITHLPQIAALADQQFVVGKTEAKGRTTSNVKKLSNAERVEEIARMIGGVKVGDLVIYGKYSGSDVEVSNKELKILRESDILAKLVK